jgi:hypothetical protein
MRRFLPENGMYFLVFILLIAFYLEYRSNCCPIVRMNMFMGDPDASHGTP